MRKRLLLLAAASLLAALPGFGICQQECRHSSSGETFCGLGLYMVDCDVAFNCNWHQDCATCGGYWECEGYCVGDQCLRA